VREPPPRIASARDLLPQIELRFGVKEVRIMMGILGWILFGLVVGALAKLVMPGRDPGGFIVTILLGIIGAVLGGYIGRAMGFYGPNEPAGFVMSFIGAVILLAIYRAVVHRRHPVA
jgi:uncharacterized membrane protein YeaQ/YmgE (transglycosylase-associated protein family)